MVHVGRSGSTVVGDMLGRHRKIVWDGEIFQQIFQARQIADQSLPVISDVDPVSFAQGRAAGVLTPVYGFEAKFFHLRALGMDPHHWIEALDERLQPVRYVALRRRNLLRVVVSTLAARASGVWHVRSGREAPATRVRLDPSAVFVNREDRPLLDLLAEFERDMAQLERTLDGRPLLSLSYEDDVQANPSRAYERICAFAGLRSEQPQARFRRTSPRPLRDLIQNFDDVAAALHGTSFEWMVEE